jgi:flagellar basal-body rod protein FlgB
MGGIGDVTMDAVEYALGGVALRSEVRANNIANANTPGYTASTVEFEDALAQALGSGSPDAAAAPTVSDAEGARDENGNSVSLEHEMAGGVQDTLLYDTLVQSFRYKLALIRSAIGAK